MQRKKETKQAKKQNLGVCSSCWRYKQFKDNCHFFWENKSECSKFLEHQLAEEKYARKGIVE